MRLVPGVRFEDNVEAMGESFGTLIPHVGGQRRDWNTVMIDGVLGNEIGQANRLAQTINLDSIAEVKVLLNNYRAEYGRTGGGQVQIITKSGGSLVRRQRVLLRPPRGAECEQLLQQASGSAETGVSLQHVRRKSRRPGAGREGESVLLLLGRGSGQRASGKPAVVDNADRPRTAWGLLADVQLRRSADRHPRPADRPAVPGQHHSRRAVQSERPSVVEPAADADDFRSRHHRRELQPSDPGDHREPQTQSDCASRLETVRQRSLLLHLQGLVLRSARRRRRRRHHRRTRCDGAGFRRITRAPTAEAPPITPRSSTRTS